ncbi:hypothetical protein PtB15_6B641 [Puccinia triticina]|nr:hypothetical protein PtB15_6B641 [Puccinia triticina]
MPCIDCGAAVADRVYQLIGALLVAAPAVAAHPSSNSVAEPNLSCLLLSQANRHSNGSHRVSGDSSPLALISDDKELICKEADNMRRPAKAAKPSLVGDNVDWMPGIGQK